MNEKTYTGGSVIEQMKKQVKIPAKLLISILFSLTVFTGLAVFTDPGEIINAVEQADIYLLLLALVAANLPLLIFAFTWQKMFHAVGIDLSYVRSLQILLSNTFVNNITPFGNIGGEAAATYFITKFSDHSAGKVFSAIFASSLINFSPLLTLLVLGMISSLYLELFSLLLAASVLAAALLYFLKSSELSKNPKIVDLMPEKFKGFFSDFRESFGLLSESRSRLLMLLGLSHVAGLLDLLAVVLVGAAYGVNLFSPLILVAVPLGRLSNYFPTPGGTGSYELAFTGLLVFFFGIAPATAVSIAVTYRVLTYYTGILTGYISIVSLGFGRGLSEIGSGWSD